MPLSPADKTRLVEYIRQRTCEEPDHGAHRPEQVAARLGEDFAIHRDDIPDTADPAKAGRALPPRVIRQLCAYLADIWSPEMRCAIEVAITVAEL